MPSLLSLIIRNTERGKDASFFAVRSRLNLTEAVTDIKT